MLDEVMIPGASFPAEQVRERSLEMAAADKTKKQDTPRFLISLDVGIGDAVGIGLSALDQIIQNDPDAVGKIDVLCNPIQAQLFRHDPRINLVIQNDKPFFPGLHISKWLRGIIIDSEAEKLIDFLRARRYEAIFPSVVAPGLYWRLGIPLMLPNIPQLTIALFTLEKQTDLSMRKVARQIVNRYFKRDLPLSELDEEVVVYLDTKEIQKAQALVAHMKQMAGVPEGEGKVLLVATDSASVVTRPPMPLLAAALAAVLNAHRHVIVGILPSYTESMASENLRSALAPAFGSRIFMIAAEPRPTLLETTALIDQADILVSGDTGVMHLAAATKRIAQPENSTPFVPRNSVKIIVLFGGTNPDLYGYKTRTLIIGRGRREQLAFCPGFAKGIYKPGRKDLFDHISPQEVAQGIMSLL